MNVTMVRKSVFTLTNLWTVLTVFGLAVLFTGLFVHAESVKYTATTDSVVEKGNGNTAAVTYKVNGERYQALVSTDSGTGETVSLLYDPRDPSNAVVDIEGHHIASYVLTSVGGAMVIAFFLCYMFVPNRKLF